MISDPKRVGQPTRLRQRCLLCADRLHDRGGARTELSVFGKQAAADQRVAEPSTGIETRESTSVTLRNYRADGTPISTTSLPAERSCSWRSRSIREANSACGFTTGSPVERRSPRRQPLLSRSQPTAERTNNAGSGSDVRLFWSLRRYRTDGDSTDVGAALEDRLSEAMTNAITHNPVAEPGVTAIVTDTDGWLEIEIDGADGATAMIRLPAITDADTVADIVRRPTVLFR